MTDSNRFHHYPFLEIMRLLLLEEEQDYQNQQSILLEPHEFKCVCSTKYLTEYNNWYFGDKVLELNMVVFFFKQVVDSFQQDKHSNFMRDASNVALS